MNKLDEIREAAAPILKWWALHTEAGVPMKDEQTVMYFRGHRVTAAQMRALARALATDHPAAPMPQQ